MDQFRNFSYDAEKKAAFYEFDEDELAAYEQEEQEKKALAAQQRERRLQKRPVTSTHAIKTHFTTESQRNFGSKRLKSANEKNRQSRSNLRESKESPEKELTAGEVT